MKNKYNLDQEVEVTFRGKIVEIYKSGDKIRYAVDDGDTFARRLKENQIYTLSTPEALERQV